MFKKIVWLGFSSKWKNSKDVKKYIKSLVESWAWEFFTWYNPPYWHDKYGFEISPNGRFAEHEQICDFETLKDIVQEVHSYDLEIFINLNAWYYSDETFSIIKKMIKEFQELDIDWIICWNIWVLEYLKNIWYTWKINISTILAVYNTESIKFLLENYKVNKLILSREVTLEEIEELVLSFPDVSFEVFWEWDFCRYNNWLCFAEHKYGSRDICTVVVNDLIYKKKFRSDFKKVILDKSLSNEEKNNLFNDSYLNDFDNISSILWKVDIWLLDINSLNEDLLKLILKNKNNPDLFFDWLLSVSDEKNKNILIYLRWLKYLLNNNINIDNSKLDILNLLKDELELSLKTYIDFNKNKIKDLWGEAKMKSLELWEFYNRSDSLNLYTYLFFDKFKNIDTVKFPTRWRSYSEKIKLIEEVLEVWEINDKKLINRWNSLDRTHYDLSYLFDKNKLWFREFLKEKFGKKL